MNGDGSDDLEQPEAETTVQETVEQEDAVDLLVGVGDIDGLEKVSAEFARAWWKTLMANSVALVEDAALLAEHRSPGRAQALLVLAMEELAKARWLYEEAADSWTAPLGVYGMRPRQSLPVWVPRQLSMRRLPHLEKLQAAERFASGLAGFWHVDRRMEYYLPADLDTFEYAARHRNADKQAGFYVDRVGEELLTPLAIPTDGVGEFLLNAAQCVEMHLIEDHTRQQDATLTSLIDSVQDLHWAILPIAHPEEFTDFLARNTRSDEPDN